jgi:hypothetical protein
MDFDFSAHDYNNYDSSAIRIVKKRVCGFHNLVLVDYRYFYNAFREVYDRYHTFRRMNIEQIDLSTIVSLFIGQISDKDFNKYLFVFVKPSTMDSDVEQFNLESIISQYSNCLFIEAENDESDFCGSVYQLLKNYYLNDDFFHLDKFVLITDDAVVNDLLIHIAPHVNWGNPNPDVILVRNYNLETTMDGRFKYVVMDIWIASVLGISIQEMGELDAWIESNDN